MVFYSFPCSLSAGKTLFVDEEMSELKVQDCRLHDGNTKDPSNDADDRPLQSTHSVPNIAQMTFAKLLNPQKNHGALALIVDTQSLLTCLLILHAYS